MNVRMVDIPPAVRAAMGQATPVKPPRAARGQGRVGRGKAERCAAISADAGREPIRLVLPYPPSANRYWRQWKGRTIVSRQAKAYKAAVARIAVEVRPFVGPVILSVDAYRPARRGDLDNTLKVLGDSLIGIAFADDSQVVRIVAERFDDKANPRAVVTVSGANAADAAEQR